MTYSIMTASSWMTASKSLYKVLLVPPFVCSSCGSSEDGWLPQIAYTSGQGGGENPLEEKKNAYEKIVEVPMRKL
jgi:hypothetical protein